MTNRLQTLRLGTRGSPLALAQAHMVRDALLTHHGDGLVVEIVPVIATGDRIQDRALADIGGKALWTKELDAALCTCEIDFAVHSMKDVETVRPESLSLVAMLPRAAVQDRLIGAASLNDLPRGARVGTSAPRRRAQLLRLRPDLDICLLRGNINTRLEKVRNGDVDATLLAAAGLDRLGIEEGSDIPVDVLLPAPSQGAIGIEARAGASNVQQLLSVIIDHATMACVLAERDFLSGLNAGCRSPVAAQATLIAGKIHLVAEILSEDGQEHHRGEAVFKVDDRAGPAALAARLLDRASTELKALFR